MLLQGKKIYTPLVTAGYGFGCGCRCGQKNLRVRVRVWEWFNNLKRMRVWVQCGCKSPTKMIEDVDAVQADQGLHWANSNFRPNCA